ncbi:uncharacterized protein LOC141906675 isoform X2 [Tubulanus polymorphus]|uniref:uncharacterized protein LOC141906675 isoform X2 n=1 Tax=Tubulanus polymorphus TaxID=672921 RepID=UPI003DA36B0B
MIIRSVKPWAMKKAAAANAAAVAAALVILVFFYPNSSGVMALSITLTSNRNTDMLTTDWYNMTCTIRDFPDPAGVSSVFRVEPEGPMDTAPRNSYVTFNTNCKKYPARAFKNTTLFIDFNTFDIKCTGDNPEGSGTEANLTMTFKMFDDRWYNYGTPVFKCIVGNVLDSLQYTLTDVPQLINMTSSDDKTEFTCLAGDSVDEGTGACTFSQYSYKWTVNGTEPKDPVSITNDPVNNDSCPLIPKWPKYRSKSVLVLENATEIKNVRCCAYDVNNLNKLVKCQPEEEPTTGPITELCDDGWCKCNVPACVSVIVIVIIIVISGLMISIICYCKKMNNCNNPNNNSNCNSSPKVNGNMNQAFQNPGEVGAVPMSTDPQRNTSKQNEDVNLVAPAERDNPDGAVNPEQFQDEHKTKSELSGQDRALPSRPLPPVSPTVKDGLILRPPDEFADSPFKRALPLPPLNALAPTEPEQTSPKRHRRKKKKHHHRRHESERSPGDGGHDSDDAVHRPRRFENKIQPEEFTGAEGMTAVISSFDGSVHYESGVSENGSSRRRAKQRPEISEPVEVKYPRITSGFTDDIETGSIV